MVPRHFVYDTSSTDISSTDISSTTVYQRVGQLYIQLLFQRIIILINSNFYLHYDSFFINPTSTDTMIIDLQHIIWLASIVAVTIQLVLSSKRRLFLSIPLLVRKNSLH